MQNLFTRSASTNSPSSNKVLGVLRKAKNFFKKLGLFAEGATLVLAGACKFEVNPLPYDRIGDCKEPAVTCSVETFGVAKQCLCGGEADEDASKPMSVTCEKVNGKYTWMISASKPAALCNVNPYCSDSDNGDLLIQGVTETGVDVGRVRQPPSRTELDICETETSVTEFTCDGSSLSYEVLPCPNDHICEAGRCRQRIHEAYCEGPTSANVLTQETTLTGEYIEGVRQPPSRTELDICETETSVTEFTCDGSSLSYEVLPCPNDHICEAGRCRQRIHEAYCTDSDNGIDIGVIGTTESGERIEGEIDPATVVTEVDVCADAISVREFSCNGDIMVEDIITCDEEVSCVNGKCATRLPNPVLHLTFNEVDGATAFDLSGNGNNGTLSPDGAFWDPDGRINSTIYFDGTGGVTVLDSPSLTPLDQITMAAWFKMLVDFPERSANNIFGKTLGVGTGGRQGWGLATIYYGGDTVRPITSIGLDSGPGPNTLDSTTGLITDTWYHFVATYDGDSVRLFINSVNTVTEIRGADTIYNPLVDLVIGGAVADVANNFNGVIDDLRVYNVALTPEQILVLYNAGLGTEVTRPVMP